MFAKRRRNQISKPEKIMKLLLLVSCHGAPLILRGRAILTTFGPFDITDGHPSRALSGRIRFRLAKRAAWICGIERCLHHRHSYAALENPLAPEVIEICVAKNHRP